MDVAYGVESRKQAIRILDNQKLTLITQYDELTQDATEHRLVLDAINQLPKDRRCFRVVGGVAIETTVDNVKPQLEMEAGKIKDLQKVVEKQLETINQQLLKVKGEEIPKN
ncbi:prefoldin subunit 2 [Babesia microti strain RI]|uniref:Prefoldin subunit 2 n=1 Tax=Babesia microti (strain RI) TaxID=1133968 RepID=A0A1R4AAP2_BABMR|nr:prefoldin subunit 2 [Babesia microti strain RI]SJK86055.1 prefoldin subunit 2 [Babesia microti strain RI]|eukprot:XP_021338252.1 prefoldin subunit 2 [Babesia microti strain RI]